MGPKVPAPAPIFIGLTKDLFIVVLSDAGRRSLDDDTCVRILREGGFLPAHGVAMVALAQMYTCIQILDEGGFLRKRGFVLVDLHNVPDGLSAQEKKKYLLENGANICPSGADAIIGSGPRSELR